MTTSEVLASNSYLAREEPIAEICHLSAMALEKVVSRALNNDSHVRLTPDELRFVYGFNEYAGCLTSDESDRVAELRQKRPQPVKDLNRVFRDITTLDRDIQLDYLESAHGLRLPKKAVDGDICLRGIASVFKVRFPRTVHGDIHLNNVKDMFWASLPDSIEGTLYLNRQTPSPEIKRLHLLRPDVDVEVAKS